MFLHKLRTKRALRIFDVIILAVTVLSILIFALSKLNVKTAQECNVSMTNHALYLNHDSFSQPTLTVKRCETITLVNIDTAPYYVFFGPHEHHEEYPGYDPQQLNHNESVSFTAVKTGSFKLHDHLRDNAQLTLTVQ